MDTEESSNFAESFQGVGTLTAILGSLPGLFYVIDEQSRFLRWNKNLETISGYSADEILHMTPPDFFAGGDKITIAENIKKVFRTGTATAEAVLVAKDETKTPHFFTGKRVEIDGSPCLVGMGFDITERKRSEIELRRFRLAMDSSVDSVYLTDLVTMRFVDVNESACRRLGYSRETLLGMGPHEVLREERAQLERKFQGVIAAGAQGIISESVYETSSGDQRWTELHRRAFQLDERWLIVSIGRDVTDRKRTEHKLAESEASFRAIFEQSSAGISVWTSDGTLLSANNAYARFLGYEVKDLIGRNIGDLRPMEVRSEGDRRRAELLAGKADSYMWERPFMHKDGRPLWGRLAVAVVREPDGSPSFFISVLVDITSEREAKAQIEQLNSDLEGRVVERTAELQRANEELESFSYSVAHDLRAPLRAIAGFSGLVLKSYSGDTSGPVLHYLKRVEANAAHMGVLIDDLLEFARTSRTELRRTKVDMRDMADKVVQELLPLAEKNVEIEIHDLPSALGDATQLRQVWRNLIGNAIKFSSKVAVPRIEIGFTESNIGRAYYVRDNGCGFQAEYADKLFGVFQRLHSTNEFEGSGIGLAIVKRIVEKHGGMVSAQSVPDHGATFYFTLPST